ncbi:MAG TPA: fatty acid desaturase [Lacipirellulaceae bacterium]|nr:fatty acid desaturase [Lacipirellulaceae bacterium]
MNTSSDPHALALHASDHAADPANRSSWPSAKPGEFDARQAKAIISDLFTPDARIYWMDMIATAAAAYSAATVYFLTPWANPLKSVMLLVAGFGLFRAGAFIHEIQHFSGNSMRRFTTGWNLLCGIPMLSPSFLYDNHASHHSRATYGTVDDGEYLPLGRGAWGHFAVYVLQAVLLPLIVAFRFLFLTPLALISRAWRYFVLRRVSYYGINPHYRHTPPDPLPRSWAWLEAACMARAWMIPGAVVLGLNPPHRIFDLYILASVSLGLNYVRNVAAHRYRSEGEPMTYSEQLLDSISITGHPVWTELLFPVGLRYHALHHIFPTIPYHNLARAHQRLMQELPADSPYRRTVYPSFAAVLRQLAGDVREARAAAQAPEARTAA